MLTSDGKEIGVKSEAPSRFKSYKSNRVVRTGSSVGSTPTNERVAKKSHGDVGPYGEAHYTPGTDRPRPKTDKGKPILVLALDKDPSNLCGLSLVPWQSGHANKNERTRVYQSSNSVILPRPSSKLGLSPKRG